MIRALPRALSTDATGLLAIAAMLGMIVRAVPLAGLDFPLGDGGMFAVMAQDLRDAGFALPAFTSYNGGTIPFAYPPLGLYLVALLPGDPVVTERWLPFLWSVLGIYAFWLLARELHERSAGVATIAFALLPASYAWEIMGGGVTRALGLMLGLLSLAAVAAALRRPAYPTALLGGLVGGLAALAHPGETLMVAAGAVLLWLLVDRSMRGLLTLVLTASTAAVVMLPWLVVVLGQHGLEPFLAVLETHAGPPSRWSAVALALALGWSLTLVIDHAGRWRTPFAVALLLTAFIGSIGSQSDSILYAVPESDRREVAELPDGTYAVVTGNLGDDHLVEWFPALSGAISVGTYQGTEWRGDWSEAVARHMQIQRCRCAGPGERLWLAD